MDRLLSKDLVEYKTVAESGSTPLETFVPDLQWEAVEGSEILLDPDYLLEELAGERNE